MLTKLIGGAIGFRRDWEHMWADGQGQAQGYIGCDAMLYVNRLSDAAVISWDDIAASNSGNLANAAERPDAMLEDAERKRLLVEAITQLPESERLSITLYYMEELRLKEIGRVLNLSESRVSRLLKSAEHRIEEHIRAKEDDAA